MAEQLSQLDILTDIERVAIEQPGLRQRSKALVAVTELATKIGLSGDTHTVLMERIRGLDKGEAKLAWKTLGDMNELLDMLSIDLREAGEGEIPLHQTPVSTAVRTEESGASLAAGPFIEEVPRDEAPVARVEAPAIQDALNSLIASEGEQRGYISERVESVLEQLSRGGVVIDITAEDFTHDTLKQLARIYSEATKADPDMVKTHISCTWGWLSGVDMTDLMIWRSATKPGATRQDVHNSRASFINGVIKGWKNGAQLEQEDTEGHGEGLHLVTGEDVPADEVLDDETPHISETLLERAIDEEPKHIQVAKAYVDKLQLSVNVRAFEELLNPLTKGEYTPAKMAVIETLRNRVGNIAADGRIIDDLEVSARAKAALRRMLGMGFVRHGKPEERHPEPLKDQLRKISSVDYDSYAEDLYTALFALLEKLPAPEQDSVKPLQVIFTEDGDARLA